MVNVWNIFLSGLMVNHSDLLYDFKLPVIYHFSYVLERA